MRSQRSFVRPLQVLSLGVCLLFAPLSVAGEAGEWSLPDSRMGVRTAPLLLLTRPDVQADLHLAPAQIVAIHGTLEELTQRGRALRGKSGAEVVAERRAIDDAQSHWLTANLSDPQLERLSQIDLQWEGSSALVSRPTVVDTLRLSGRQVRELTQLLADRNARILKSGFDPTAETAIRRQALAVLTNPQLQAWNGMLGERCKFATAAPAAPSEDGAARQAEHVAPR